MKSFETSCYGKRFRGLQQKIEETKLPSRNPIPNNTIPQGRKNRWIGINEFKKNHTNNKREYYRNEYLKSEHWKNLKYEKLNKICYCEKCGNKNNIDVHHLNYKNLYDVKLEDLQVLCRKCHSNEHNYEELCNLEKQKIKMGL